MDKVTASKALEWARTGVSPSMSVSAFARLLGIPRSTYQSYKALEATAPEEVLMKAGEMRGLPPDWYKNFASSQHIVRETLSPYGRKHSELQPIGQSVPMVFTPCVGVLTKGSIRDLDMQRSMEPVAIPANMSGPRHVVAIADQDDSGPKYPHGSQLIFIEGKRGIVGKRVAVKLGPNESSLREVAWDGTRIVYRSYTEKSDLSQQECEEEGLLVGIIYVNKPGKFKGEYDEDGI